GALGHQDVGFDNLVDAFQKDRDLSRHPLFQVVFSLQVAPMQPMTSAGLEMTPIDVDSGTARFDLELVLWDLESGLAGLLEYNTELFDPASMVRFEHHYQQLLRSAAEQPEVPVDQLSLVTPAEQYEILAAGRGEMPQGQHGAVDDRPIQDQIALHARARGDAIAIIDGSQQWTFAILEQRVARLARQLNALGVGRDDIVAVFLERSALLVMSELAVLRSGGAYAPLDPSFPPSRLAFLLDDCGAGVVITRRDLQPRVASFQGRCLCLDDQDSESLEGTRGVQRSTGGTRPEATLPQQRAYVIYTSGSTGMPKGVEIEHCALSNFVNWFQRTFAVSAPDRGAVIASPTFDTSIIDVWPFLAAGAAVVVAHDEVRTSPPRLRDWLIENRISALFLTALVGESLLSLPWPEQCGLRALIAGGEQVHRSPPPSFPATFHNGYGPTENTVLSTCGPIPPRTDEDAGRLAPAPALGRPVGGVDLMIMDRSLHLVPDAIPGELCLGGVSLARAYLRRPGLTAERFVPAPFGPAGARLYRTGDLVRRRTDGELAFLGRNDHQVKIRGFRIELGEIETALLAQSSVREAAVAVHGSLQEDRHLLAYIVPVGDTLDPSALRNALALELPPYMVPALFVQLERLPLNTNGKLDRRALPAPEQMGIERSTAPYVAPRTPAEVVLAEIFAELLTVERVGVDDNFFDLGGQSLLVTQALSRCRRAFGIDLPLRTFFEQPTVAALAAKLQQSPEHSLQLPTLEPAARNRPLPLSFAQERLWFLDQLIPELSAYNVPGLVRMRGPLKVRLLERTFGEIVRRHEILRTTYQPGENGQPVQVVQPAGPFVIPLVDLTGQPNCEERALGIANRMVRRPFDLARDAILRPLLIRLGPGDHMLAVAIHHIGFDMWSREHFIRELGVLYRALLEGSPTPLPEPTIQYADFACWQRDWMAGEHLDGLLDYWRQQLDGADLNLRLPVDRQRVEAQGFRGRRKLVMLPTTAGERARQLSRRASTSPYVVFLAAVTTLLSRYTQQEDLVVGSPIANRHRQAVEGLIGFFVNTLVLRAVMVDNPTFLEHVKRLKEVFFGAFAHQDLPVERLTQELRSERDWHHQPLFQATFNYLENYVPKPLEIGDLTMSIDRRIYNGGVVTDFSLAMFEVDGTFNMVLDYSSDLFDDTTAERMLRHLGDLITRAGEDPSCHLRSLPLLSPAQSQQLRHEWNDTRAPFPAGRTVDALFTEVAARHQGDVAVACEDLELTYGELEQRANQLAHTLRARGVQRETPVAIAIERSVEMVVGLLAILKAGGYYQPLDPTWPARRLQLMLEDTGARLAVTQPHLAACLEAPKTGLSNPIEMVFVDLKEPLHEASGAPPLALASSDNLAYVCHTSGSTGRPKGVAVDHRAVVRLVRESTFVDFSSRHVFLMLVPLTFDVSTFEIWGPLLNGARLAVHPAREIALDALGATIKRHRVTTLWLTSGLFHLMIDERPDDLAGVEQLLAGGDIVSARHAQARLEAHPDGIFIDGYGPTESTTFATSQRLVAGDFIGSSVPIGRPIANTTTHVTNRWLTAVPPGVEGELMIGGVGVARGYLGRPALTAERFVPDPLSGTPGSRLYRSGDLVRCANSGRIELFGRNDSQIKIRGFRIELGEIETTLLSHARVRKAIVMASEVGAGPSRHLIAYVELGPAPAETDAEVEIEELRQYLAQSLPAFMVPEHFAFVDAMPLTANGKIDRQALTTISAKTAAEEAHVAPRNELEHDIAELCRELLGVERVGIHDHFFRLGGHSLLATQLLSRLGARFQIELSLPGFFEAPTVADLANSIEVTRWAAGQTSLDDVDSETAVRDWEEVEL
ncbi:MAG: amino acid adenylation domain-containing protein, partial [Acidobacteriota bacterium]